MREHERIGLEWGIPLAIAILAVGARAAINAERATLVGVIRSIITGLFVGVEVNLYLLTTDFSQEWRGALVGLAAAISNELLIALIAIGKTIAKDPAGALRWVINRGGKQ